MLDFLANAQDREDRRRERNPTKPNGLNETYRAAWVFKLLRVVYPIKGKT